MNTSFNKTPRYAFTFSLLVLISSGCEDTFFNGDNRIIVDNPVKDNIVVNPLNFIDYILYATFESDAVETGGQPNKTLPGGPAGDELIYDDPWPQIRVTNAHGQKSTLLTVTSSMEFVSKPTPIVSTDKITVRWSGQANYKFNNQYGTWTGSNHITFTDGSGNILASFLFGKSSIHVLSIPEMTLPISEQPLEQHTFTLTFYPHLGYYNLKFVDQDGTVLTQNAIPFLYSYNSSTIDQRFTLMIKRNHAGYYSADYVTMEKTKFIGPIGPPI